MSGPSETRGGSEAAGTPVQPPTRTARATASSIPPRVRPLREVITVPAPGVRRRNHRSAMRRASRRCRARGLVGGGRETRVIQRDHPCALEPADRTRNVEFLQGVRAGLAPALPECTTTLLRFRQLITAPVLAIFLLV